MSDFYDIFLMFLLWFIGLCMGFLLDFTIREFIIQDQNEKIREIERKYNER